MTKIAAIKLPDEKRQPKSLTILGSTGTIGKNTIRLVEEDRKSFSIDTLTAGTNVKELANQARRLDAKTAVIGRDNLYKELKESLSGTDIEVLAGKEAIAEVAGRKNDIIIAGIVGAASLAPTLAAIKSGATIALANKECLVCAGELMTSEVKKYGATLIPVDSEHNAAFQSFDFKHPETIEKITLTASGGPFRLISRKEMEEVTPKQATNHPNWKMGAKISVDSATMMNKGLEVIEAYHLFPVKKDQIDVIIHPESIIHSLVYYKDGSVISGLSVPDMCVPISYALGWPKRINTKTQRLNLADIGKLTFEQTDEIKFPSLRIAREVLNTGGTAPAILNAANEVAVENFITGKIGFLEIINVVENTLEKIPAEKMQSLEQVFEIDRKSREIANSLIKGI